MNDPRLNLVRGRMIYESVGRRIEEFSQYISEIENKFERDKQILSETSSSADPESDEDYYFLEGLAEDYYTIETVFVSIHRRSILVSLYSFLEDSMNGLCRSLQRVNDYPLKLKDLNGDGIVRARDYLTKVVALDLTEANTHWEKIRELNRVRNCIVHAEGYISRTENEKLKQIIEKADHLELESECKLVIKKEYIESSLDSVRSFLEFIHRKTLIPERQS